MRVLRSLAGAALLLLSTVSSHSVNRNPLHTLGVVKNPSILTQNHRVTALSSFDLTLELHGRPIRLSLEPNHDIIQDGAMVEYLGPDGEVVRTEPLNRLDYKVYKGRSWVRRMGDQGWDHAGWARIVVRRDGITPLFEGAFAIGDDHHHIQMSSNYMKTRHELDPQLKLDDVDDEFMVCFRDSDISLLNEHGELRRSVDTPMACRSDSLGFNMQPDHPVYAAMLRRSESSWTNPFSSVFGKRQLDNTSGGNSAGVNLTTTIGQTSGCPTTRKVALVGVATDCTYTADFNSSESARQNVIQQMNSASDLYESTFNITLGLANLTVSDPTCPGTAPASAPWNVPCGDTDIQERLNIFSAWRGSKTDSNSHWTLLSTCNTGSAVGLAWLGQACVQGSQGSNSSDGTSETVASANVVIRTSTEWQVIAHETGHTFGAVHDCTSSTCSDGQSVTAQQCCPLSSSTCDAGEKYIMNPSTAAGITKFSPCSIGNICSAMGRNSVKSTCLTNNKGVTTITGQQCGNGIVEDGEDCDCGGETSCGDNACCDATTCKFKSGAVCDDSNEDCCQNCQLASASVVCRASTGECDPEETCSGTSPYCPEDTTKNDGDSCGTSGKGLTCASGQCTSRDTQCKTVMGSYTTGNDTYACDSSSCSLSCASPEFGTGVCYGLQQNFLDGTTCGGGGKCSNGVCKGSSFGKEVTSWIDQHKPLVIGIACALGGLLLLSILGCLTRSCRRRRYQKRRINATSAWPAGVQYGSRGQLLNEQPQMTGARGGAGNGGLVDRAGWYPPPPPSQQSAGFRGGGGTGAGMPPPPPPYRNPSVRYA